MSTKVDGEDGDVAICMYMYQTMYNVECTIQVFSVCGDAFVRCTKVNKNFTISTQQLTYSR